jgi:hypothetical protein
MKIAHIGLLWAALCLSGCATTCDSIKITKQTLADNRTKVVFKCSDKVIEATVKRAPECLDACWKPAE